MPVVLMLQRFPANTAPLSLNFDGAFWPSVLTLMHLSLTCIKTEGNSRSSKTPILPFILDLVCKCLTSQLFKACLCVFINDF